mmetsp:Transcript_34558/g.35228  ORF Transcript_34558/g.35228 Transcript_34558/m.35228 type:complete len:167 (+) Transcript_34558:199-699(+)
MSLPYQGITLNIFIVYTLLFFVNGYRFSSSFSELRKVSKCTATMRSVDENDEIQQYMKFSEMIFILPMAKITMNELSNFRKTLPSSVYASVIKSEKLIQAVDGTPFCQIAAHVYGSVFVVLIKQDTEKAYDSFTKWIRQLSKDNSNGANSNFIIGKKGHIIRIHSE